MYNEEDRKWLYGQFKDNGYDTGSYEDFIKSLDNDDDFNWWHQEALGLGLEVGDIDEFSSMFRTPKETESQAPDPNNLMFWDEPQAVGRTAKPNTKGPKLVTPEKPKSENKPYVPLNLPYQGEFSPETTPDIQVPMAPENADEMAAENERRRSVSKYAPGRQDDNTMYVNPSDELILENASQGKGYSIEGAVQAGKEYESILADNALLSERIKAYNEEDSLWKSIGLPSGEEGMAKVNAHQREYDEISKLAKANEERYTALIYQ